MFIASGTFEKLLFCRILAMEGVILPSALHPLHSQRRSVDAEAIGASTTIQIFGFVKMITIIASRRGSDIIVVIEAHRLGHCTLSCTYIDGYTKTFKRIQISSAVETPATIAFT
ncbi:hypothetical protein Plhal710r2_c014g0064431 [Plasmopara halstedii]